MTPVVLPQLSLAMEEGKLVRWLVPNEAHVRVGQPIAEVETDKAITEIEAPAEGTLRRFIDEGVTVPVKTVVAEIVDAPRPSHSRSNVVAAESVPDEELALASIAGLASEQSPMPAVARPPRRASPAARRLARERGIDLDQVQNMSAAARITASQVERMAASAPQASLRESVVTQLSANWREIPHIHVGGEIDGSGLAAAKRAVRVGITITDLLVLGLTRALREVPELNGLVGNPSERVHVSLAIATPDGVLSPVIRNAHELLLDEIAQERARLVAAARARRTDRRDLGGGTITLTNLGAYPVDFFAPVISGPQISTVATGRLADRAVVQDKSVVIRPRIWTNVAVDHRAADGVIAARLLAALERCFNKLPL
jgi:pyruvate dehydrogenase E2 component (dihydrolipoamide acetyltransferase)